MGKQADKFEQWRQSGRALMHGAVYGSMARLQAERLVTVIEENEQLVNLNTRQAETIRGLLRDNEDVNTLRNSVEVLERRLRQREERIERMKAKEERNRGAFMRMRDELLRLREKFRPLAAGPDVRTLLGLNFVIDFGSKHRGETMAHAAASDPSWVIWLENEHSSMRPATEVLNVARDVISGMRRRTGSFTNFSGEPVSARMGWNEVSHAPDAAAAFRKGSLAMSLMQAVPDPEHLAAAVHRSKYGRAYTLDEDCYFPPAEWWK